MSNFRPVDRETSFLLPPSVDDWLPKGEASGALCRRGRRECRSAGDGGKLPRLGPAADHPSVLLGLLIDGYATGVFSSRKLERATYDLVAFRFIAANQHPDHDTIAAFRKRFLKEIEALFVRVLMLAREMGVLKMGTVALDGTQMKSSRHSALSYEHATKLEATARTGSRGAFGQGGSCRRSGPSRRHVDPRRARLA